MAMQHEILKVWRENNPARRFAGSWDGNAVGVWDDRLGRFVMFISRAITGEWVRLSFEVRVDGKPPYGAGDWAE